MTIFFQKKRVFVFFVVDRVRDSAKKIVFKTFPVASIVCQSLDFFLSKTKFGTKFVLGNEVALSVAIILTLDRFVLLKWHLRRVNV